MPVLDLPWILGSFLQLKVGVNGKENFLQVLSDLGK